MTEIPKEAAIQTERQGIIPQRVAELPQDQEAPEIKPYVISFAKYNEDMCEIEVLDSNKARKAIATLKTIGTKIRSESDFQKNHVDRIPVRRESEYIKLYRGLTDEIDLKEIKLQQAARIFYFDIEPEQTLYVVAITQNHLETKKVRR